MTVKTFDGTSFDYTIPVVVVGAGACGMTAALAANDAGANVLVLERDSVPMGTTAMSSGLIPAAGTAAQKIAGVFDDTSERFADDLVSKTKNAASRKRILNICRQSTLTIDWLIDDHHIPLTLFKAGGALPGHSRSRLHGTPNRTGEELIASLLSAAAAAGIDIVTDACVTAIIADQTKRVRGIEITRPDGAVERIGCDALIFACCGFAGNPELVARHIPEISQAVPHTHPGAQGDALAWGEEIGAATADLTGYQGHANLAAGYGLLVSWISMSEGGFQVNSRGERFNNEARGYSEHAVDVTAQPDGYAWAIYDSRIDAIIRELAEYRDVVAAGALRHGQDVAELANAIRVPEEALKKTFYDVKSYVASGQPDEFGRQFSKERDLKPPYIAVKVHGALFHTQGGLEVDDHARVIGTDGKPLPNLFAGGGAARGISGPTADGYVAGNGLMTATTLGRLAGQAAANLVT